MWFYLYSFSDNGKHSLARRERFIVAAKGGGLSLPRAERWGWPICVERWHQSHCLQHVTNREQGQDGHIASKATKRVNTYHLA
jgi:hypothetical protein